MKLKTFIQSACGNVYPTTKWKYKTGTQLAELLKTFGKKFISFFKNKILYRCAMFLSFYH